MIDSVRIKVLKSQNSTFYDFCLQNSNNKLIGCIVENTHKIALRKQEQIFAFKEIEYEENSYQIINGKLVNPSYSYHARYQIKEDEIILEFSIPKFIYGSNVIQLIYHNNPLLYSPFHLFIRSIKYFFNQLTKHDLSVKIDYRYVIITRFDVCFNQYFNTYEESKKALEYLKLKVANKHSSKNYENGLINISQNSYHKVYHKGAEFVKHDLKQLNKTELGTMSDSYSKRTYIERFLDLSSTCLRYEYQYKPSNWSYDYMTKFSKYAKYFNAYKQTLKKHASKITYDEKKIFTKLQKIYKNPRIKFTIEPNYELMEYYSNVQPLTEQFFNYLVNKYYTFIQEKYTLRNSNLDFLTKRVVQPLKKGDKRTKELRILTIVKTFGSLENALNKNVLPRSTYYRLKEYMEQNNLSTTNQKIDFNQDWTFNTYLRRLNECEISPNMINSDFLFNCNTLN